MSTRPDRHTLYDLHAHILPGVDDGPSSIEDSVEIARIAAENGTRTMLATPHRKDVTELSSVECIRGLTAQLQGRIHAESINLTFMLGMENHIDAALPQDVSEGRALTMNGSRYILVEMPFFGGIEEHDYVEGALLGLLEQGLTPVFAHPERIEAFQQKPALLERYIGMGMLSQITRGSLLGHWGEEVRRFSLELLRDGMAHILSSDTHSPYPPRTPELGGALKIAAGVVGESKAQAMVADIPRAILEDRRLVVPSATGLIGLGVENNRACGCDFTPIPPVALRKNTEKN